jgi:hypothetical protein
MILYREGAKNAKKKRAKFLSSSRSSRLRG